MLFLVGASLAFFLTIPLALKYFYVFENERNASADPVQEVMQKPLSAINLIAMDGRKIPPLGTASATPAADAPTAQEGGGALSPEMRLEIRNYLHETLTTADGANFALRYDEGREKIVLVSAKGGKSIYQVGKYISFISQLVLVFGISFQMPIVVTILVKLELLTARVMRETRSYAWVIILVLSAILTPSPDALTMGLLAGPLIFLYEICVVIATIIEKSRLRKERAEEESRSSRLEMLYAKPSSDLSEEEKAEMHRAEIEQYESEHAHLYLEESDHVSRDSLHGNSDDHSHGEGDEGESQHDESWHADDHYWHDSHDSPVATDSDHVEPEDLRPEGETETGRLEEQTHHYENNESCVPDGPVVDLNHATLEEIATLPGIEPDLAQTIIDYRRYETFDDLERVPGLSADIIRRITDRVMLG